ncbi:MULTISPECIES: type II toxin-antitoxin system PemK/MazF family toxin [Laspinema]|jgi:mRNA interferase MazF|uniref:Type II toxin-antitoxin system PemK/MazF family toxin n=1 Tax=Laspinema olomoucense D3b TaxID=2953688 RepID=A0ABT2NJ73_9CYAN|nr:MULTISPECIES: type II toxin-antitoxin system PemK/MazF family toxin [unclassified Laspinema]MCT7981380.1 type II toxin-antitoxin system PemK/MazF family toxin [Laspinema sp. D3b]MCT7986681.1 type II toxin-antitoxin system PemK/MazF family toxin [Laspinema sp. D2d]
MSSPNRGEVWLVDLGYTAKVRPCLVVSIPALMQDRALITLIPHTTSPRGSRFEVEIKTRFLKPGVFDTQNLITIPHVKLLKKLGELNPEQLSEIEKVLRFWLGLESPDSEQLT